MAIGITQPKHNDSRPTCNIVGKWEFDQARHRGVNPACSMSTSEDNNNGVGVKADTLCIAGTNTTEAFWTTDQQSHPGDKEPLDMFSR